MILAGVQGTAGQPNDNIYYYAKTAGQHKFNLEDIHRIPYMAQFGGGQKAAKGKPPTDTWWHRSLVPTARKNWLSDPKPIVILERIICASDEDDLVLDFLYGTTGQVCLNLRRRFILCDSNPQAIEMMKKRFSNYDEIEWIEL